MTILRKFVTTSVLAITLASVPMHLAAQAQAAQPEVRVSFLGWLSSIWTDLAAWLTDGERPDPISPPKRGAAPSDGGGCLDPDGRCGT